jgi:DNA-binding IclR family transcriptional regulator
MPARSRAAPVARTRRPAAAPRASAPAPAPVADTPAGQVKALAKGLRALDLLLERGDLGTNDTAAHLGVDKGAASRILHTLADLGFAVQGADRRYRPGARVHERAGVPDTTPRTSIRERARPLLQRLHDATHETAHLAIRADDQVLYLDKCETAQPLRVDRPVGTLAPLHCTALGKVLLAFAGAQLPRDLSRYTRSTAVTADALRAALERTVAAGYAQDDEEFALGVRCVAAPLFDAAGRAVAAIGVSGPTARIAAARLAELGTLVTAIARDFPH